MRTHDYAFGADRSPVAVLGVSVALLGGSSASWSRRPIRRWLRAPSPAPRPRSHSGGPPPAFAAAYRVQVDGVRAQARADDVT